MVAVFIQLSVYAMLTPLLSSACNVKAIIFLLLMRYLAVTALKRIPHRRNVLDNKKIPGLISYNYHH